MTLYGYHPPSITSLVRDSSKVQVVEYHLKHQQQVPQLLKDNLNLAQNWMKQQAYHHRRECRRLGVFKTATIQIDVPEEHQEG